jgi:hypothetical protein
MCLLLDLVEVAKSHTGANLASAFSKVLEDFGIADKVNYLIIICIQKSDSPGFNSPDS